MDPETKVYRCVCPSPGGSTNRTSTPFTVPVGSQWRAKNHEGQLWGRAITTLVAAGECDAHFLQGAPAENFEEVEV